MLKKILANDGIEADGKSALEAAGFSVDTNKVEQANLAEALKNYDIIVVRSATKVRKELIDACPHLKIIARGGVGMDNIDVAYAQSRGITVINTPNASSRAVAELAIAHMFALARMIQQSNHQLRESGADFNGLKKNYSSGIQLQGKTLGILGFGRIGQELAKMALGIGMKVIAVDPVIKSALLQFKISDQAFSIPVDTAPLSQLLSQSDFISLHVPAGEKPVLGKEEFEQMKKGACIINTARGGTVDEAALIAALDSGQLGGAGLDAFLNEPNPDPALLNHLKISITPHIGGSTREAQAAIGKELAEKIIAQYV